MLYEPIDDNSWEANYKHIASTLKQLSHSNEKQEETLVNIQLTLKELTTERGMKARINGMIGGLIPFIGLIVWWVLRNIPRTK